MKTEEYGAYVFSSNDEICQQSKLLDFLKSSPIPDSEKLSNLGLFLTSKNLARILFFYEIYKKIVNLHGIIVEGGCRWGNLTAILTNLRSILEPFNRHRKIVSFDTFSGLENVCSEDGNILGNQDFGVSSNYDVILDSILNCHESLNPVPHIKKHEIVKGDATGTSYKYFEGHHESVVALAIFDYDIYQPTRATISALRPFLMKGSILVFDEVCDEITTGETTALKKAFNMNHITLNRLPMTSRICYMEFE